MSDINLVENLSSIDLLEPEKVSEICGIAAETIAAYSTSYAELEAERDALQDELVIQKEKSNKMIARLTAILVCEIGFNKSIDLIEKLEGEG